MSKTIRDLPVWEQRKVAEKALTDLKAFMERHWPESSDEEVMRLHESEPVIREMAIALHDLIKMGDHALGLAWQDVHDETADFMAKVLRYTAVSMFVAARSVTEEVHE